MTCQHGFIGACAECDGAGQQPEAPEPEPTRACPYCDRICSVREWREQHCCDDCYSGR